MLTQAIDLLNGKESKALKSLIEIFDGVYGAILFTKTVGKRIIKSKKDLPSGEVKITLDDETSITTSKEAFKAYTNIEFRKSVKELVRPLEIDGLSTIEFSTEKKTSLSISKSDMESFLSPLLRMKNYLLQKVTFSYRL